MTIQSERIDQLTLVLTPSGRLDASAAPMFERKIKQVDDKVATLILDLTDLEYISSAGLRVLLQAWKTFDAAGRKLIIKNMQEIVREVFEMTGFIDLMVAEERFVVLKKEESTTITLSAIGELKADDIPTLEKELIKIKNVYKERNAIITVRLDMEKLSFISPEGSRRLKEIIKKSDWGKRRLAVLNASPEARNFLDGVQGIYYDDNQT